MIGRFTDIMTKPIYVKREVSSSSSAQCVRFCKASAVMTLPMALFIPAFYAGELGLPLAGVGAMIAVSRIFDVIADPLIGVVSDRLHTRWGRRKPWLAAGTPIIMLATWMLFVPTGQVSLIYLMIWTSVLSIGYSLFDLPYKAWGAELSTGYSERSGSPPGEKLLEPPDNFCFWPS